MFLVENEEVKIVEQIIGNYQAGHRSPDSAQSMRLSGLFIKRPKCKTIIMLTPEGVKKIARMKWVPDLNLRDGARVEYFLRRLHR